MIAIKYYPSTKKYVVCDGVMEEYATLAADGTFTGAAGITVQIVSKRFNTLEEATEAKNAYTEYARKYCYGDS